MFYECPKCQSQRLGVTVKVSATLTQDEDNMETDLSSSTHEWDDQSSMWCEDCGHTGLALNFQCNNLLTGESVNDSRRLLCIREVLAVTTLSRATLYRLIRSGRFPASMLIGPRRVAWRESDVLSWMDKLGSRVHATF